MLTKGELDEKDLFSSIKAGRTACYATSSSLSPRSKTKAACLPMTVAHVTHDPPSEITKPCPCETTSAPFWRIFFSREDSRHEGAVRISMSEWVFHRVKALLDQ